MIESEIPDTEQLVELAAHGDQLASKQLLVRHRSRLKRLVTVRLDSRLARRVDPSDVVQETMVLASQRLPDYLKERPIAFYPWIRQLALEQVVHEHRRHLKAQGRSLHREEAFAVPIPDHSAIALAMRLVANGSSPSQKASREELRSTVKSVLDQLSDQDREVLVLRYLEQLSTAETALVLGLTESGVKSRQRRALERFCQLFDKCSDREDF